MPIYFPKKVVGVVLLELLCDVGLYQMFKTNKLKSENNKSLILVELKVNTGQAKISFTQQGRKKKH